MELDWISRKESEPSAKTLWHQWRGHGIGSSDCPVLLGVSPWKSLYQLWLEKTDQVKDEDQFKGNWATRRGNDLEPKARDLYNRRYGCNMQVEQAESKLNPVWRASFDGIDHSERRVLEIKCPGKIDHSLAVMGEVPKKYMPQLQWLMLVSEYTELDYVSYDGTDDTEDRLWAFSNIVAVRVKADVEMQQELMTAAHKFWTENVLPRVPPQDIKEEVLESDELLEALNRFEDLRQLIKQYEIAMDGYKKIIQKYAKSPVTRCSDYKITWSERKGAIKYSDVKELNGVDLEQYRGKSTMSLLVRKL